MVLEHLLVHSGTSVHNVPAPYQNSTPKCYGTFRYYTTKCLMGMKFLIILIFPIIAHICVKSYSHPLFTLLINLNY